MELARYVVLNPVRAKGMVRTIDDWPWSSYLGMINKVNAEDWLTTDWVLSQFGGSRVQAMNRYQQFVLEGVGQNIELWSKLKGQIYLGNDEFVSKVQGKIETIHDDWSIPKKQKRAVAKSLPEIERQSVDRNSAIISAYATGAYSQREIGNYCRISIYRLHPSTVGVIVRRNNNS